MSILGDRNIRIGIAISVLGTVVSYIIVSIIASIGGFIFAGFYLYADIEFVIGTILGVGIGLNNYQQDKSILKSGVILGIIGSILSSIFIGFYHLILIAIIFSVLDFSFFLLYFGVSVISGIVIGLLGGALIATYYTYKQEKRRSEQDDSEDDFFDDLIKK